MRPSVSVTISGMVGGEVAHSVSLGCKHKVRVQEISAARERPKYAESSSMSLTFPNPPGKGWNCLDSALR